MANYPEQFTFAGGFDFHTHLREPSPINRSETYLTGTHAAALAGNVAIADISNTPGLPTWSVGRLLDKQNLVLHNSNIPVALWYGSQPESDNIVSFDLAGQYALGLKVFAHPTTGNDKHYEAEDFREKLTEWHNRTGLPVALHSGEDNLEGFIDLAEEIGLQLHNFHTSKPEDVNLISSAKERGVNVTCGVCLHHLVMSSEEVTDWSRRMQPKLEDVVDSEYLMYQTINGQVDAFETDHAPHPQKAKDEADRLNPEGIEDPNLPRCYGVRSLGVALPILLHEFHQRDVPLERFVELTSTNPARIMGIKFAESTSVTYSMETYEVTDDGPAPEGAAPSPFIGRLALGKVLETKISGKKIIENGELVGRSPKLVRKGVII
jgi:carbamoyl-phosphate synthase/aspartate carbamoyltransferase/dihydroorotase